MEILMAAGAPVVSNPEDGAVLDALHIAIANGHEACARLIWGRCKLYFEGGVSVLCWSPRARLSSACM